MKIASPLTGRVLVVADVDRVARASIDAAGLPVDTLARIAGSGSALQNPSSLAALDHTLRALPRPAAASVMQTLLQLARSPIKLSRDEFCATFGGGGFDLRALDDDDWAKLAELGVSRRRLQSLAGADAQIHAPDFDALFAWLDALDRDGSGRTIDVALSGRKGTMLTRCGVALETLRKTFVPRDVLGRPKTLDDASSHDTNSVALGVKSRLQDTAKGCLDTVKRMLAESQPKAFRELATSADGHWMAKTENGRGELSGYTADFKAGLRYIDACLDRRRPVVIGVSHSESDGNARLDGITDHFVLITGRGRDQDGRVFYTFNDPANGSSSARFYVDARSGLLFKPANERIGERWVAGRAYQATHVRLYRDLDFSVATGRSPSKTPAPSAC